MGKYNRLPKIVFGSGRREVLPTMQPQDVLSPAMGATLDG